MSDRVQVLKQGIDQAVEGRLMSIETLAWNRQYDWSEKDRIIKEHLGYIRKDILALIPDEESFLREGRESEMRANKATCPDGHEYLVNHQSAECPHERFVDLTDKPSEGRLLTDEEILKLTSHWNPVPSRLNGIAPETIKLKLFQAVAKAQRDLTRQEIQPLKDALQADAMDLWRVTNAIRKEVESHDWILEGRGCYEWDDERYRDEARHVFEAIIGLIKAVQHPAQKRFHGIMEQYQSSRQERLDRPELREKIAEIIFQGQNIINWNTAYSKADQLLALIPDEEEIRKKVKAIQNPYTAEFFPRDDKWAGQILREKGLTDDEIGGVSGALGRVAFEYIMAEIDRLLEP